MGNSKTSKKKQSQFWKSIQRPFEVCREQKVNTFLWTLFTILGGLLGIIINIIQRSVFGDVTVCESIYADSSTGNFYAYALVLISATLGPLFIGLAETEPPKFRRQKIVLASVAIFAMILDAIFYSMQTIGSEQVEKVKGASIEVDFAQLVFFIMSILIAVYALGIQYMDKNPEKHLDLESHLDQEDKDVHGLNESNEDMSPEGYGM